MKGDMSFDGTFPFLSVYVCVCACVYFFFLVDEKLPVYRALCRDLK